MKAVAVVPGQPDSIHLREVPTPRLEEVPDGRGVLVRVLRVGVDGTDREINAAEYGNAPPGDDFLILGHESLGVVEATGPAVTEVAAGDLVVATVRRPGTSFYDAIGYQDLTTDDVYFERGINLRHGYLAEYYVDSADYLVKLPAIASEVGVLVEPMSVAEKGIAHAFEIQRRMKVWRPKKAAVMGAGTLGLLATMILRLRGLEVTTFGREEPPYNNADLAQALGARYVSTRQTSITDAGARFGPFDLIFEGTGSSAVAFEAAGVLAKNGVQVLTSITGGGKKAEIPADKLNLDFVLGNKVMFGTVNAHREHFELGVRDLVQCLAQWPGWLERLLTHPVAGLEGYRQMIELLTRGKGVIKCFLQVSELAGGAGLTATASGVGSMPVVATEGWVG